jgi:hypothetical protein
MRGFTRKRGKTWTALWEGPRRIDPDTGDVTRSQQSKGGFRTQKAAQAWLSDTISSVNAGTFVEPSREPLSTFLRQWVRAVEPNVKPLTARRYRQTVEGQLAPKAIGQVPLRQLGPDQMLALLAELERCGNPGCDHADGDCRGLAVASRSVIHAVLRRALNDAVVWERSAGTLGPGSSRPRLVRRGSPRGPAASFRVSWRMLSTTGSPGCCGLRRRPGCDAANCAVCGGRTLTLTPHGCASSSKHSRHPAA